MSKSIWKWIARVMFYAVAVGLFVYAASRSLDFITATLPASQKAVGYLGLLATGGGAIAWLAVFLFYAQGTGQKGLSVLFVIVDLLGEFALFTFDTLYRSGESGMIAGLSADEIRLVILGLSALIALNIGGTVAFHILDPEASRRMREESARDVLDDEVLKVIETRAPQIASQIAPQIAAQWEADFTERFGNMTALGLGNLSTAQNKAAESEDSDNPLDWQAWLEGWKAARRNDKQEPVTYQSTAASPLPGAGELKE
jgi:hypothetical protein